MVAPPTPKVPTRLNAVLVGVTGTGKSTTGNTLCGREAFKTSDSAESETRRCAVEQYTHNSCQVCLVDTVGMADTSLTPPEALNRFLEFSDAVHDGVDVFFYTIRRDARFAPQEEESLQAFVSNCGEGVLDHTIFVFTHCSEEQQGVAKLREWASSNERLSNWVSRVGGMLGVENEENPSRARTAMHSKANFVISENGGQKYSNSALEGARERRKRLERETETLRPENRPEIYQMLVDLAAGRCKENEVEVRLQVAKGREAEERKKKEELELAVKKAEYAEERRLAAEKRAEEEAKLREETEEFYQELQNSVKRAGCSPWKKGRTRTRKDGEKKIVKEVILLQEVMRIVVKHSGDGETKKEVKVWTESQTNDGWDEAHPLSIPHSILMEPGPESDLNMLVPKVHGILQSDIEKSLRILDRSHTAQLRANGDKKATVHHSVQKCHLSKILFEGEEQDGDYYKELESYRGGQLDFNIRIEVKQSSRMRKSRGCCTIL